MSKGRFIQIAPASLPKDVKEHDEYEEEEDKKVGHLQALSLLDMFSECWDTLFYIQGQIHILKIDIEHVFLVHVNRIADALRVVYMNINILQRNGLELEAFCNLRTELISTLDQLITKSALFSQSDIHQDHKLSISKCNEVITALHILIMEPMEPCPTIIDLSSDRVELRSEVVDENGNPTPDFIEKRCCGCYMKSYKKRNLMWSMCLFLFVTCLIIFIMFSGY